jgi:hypothetical protein
MALRPAVRRAIADRQFVRPRKLIFHAETSVEVTVRIEVDYRRLKKLGGREVQLNLTILELRRIQPVQTTLFGNQGDGRKVRLIINGRRAWLLSVTNTGILVVTFKKIGG